MKPKAVTHQIETWPQFLCPFPHSSQPELPHRPGSQGYTCVISSVTELGVRPCSAKQKVNKLEIHPFKEKKKQNNDNPSPPPMFCAMLLCNSTWIFICCFPPLRDWQYLASFARKFDHCDCNSR